MATFFKGHSRQAQETTWFFQNVLKWISHSNIFNFSIGEFPDALHESSVDVTCAPAHKIVLLMTVLVKFLSLSWRWNLPEDLKNDAQFNKPRCSI